MSSTISSEVKYWAVVPAAGIGKRMQTDRPKQYLEIEGRPLIEYAISRLIADPHVEGVVVAISTEDEYWPDLEICLDIIRREQIPTVDITGGAPEMNQNFSF